MIKPIGSQHSQAKALSFKQDAATEETKGVGVPHGDKLLVKEQKRTPLLNSAKITADKFQNAVTVYPIKGLKGSRNANFYEFLTMGMFPNLVGSLTMMAVFDGMTKHFKANEAMQANKIGGKKMVLGVIFYSLAKTLSKKLIELPIKAKFGVDMNLPYKKEVNELPESANDTDLISNEYHKVFESVDFPRWDLLYDQKEFGSERNSYYDKVAKKMGLGQDLQDSDQAVKPKIKELIVKARTFTTLAAPLWAATGVAIASQKPWESFNHFLTKTNIKNTKFTKLAKMFGETFKKSTMALLQGGVDNAKSHKMGIAGKALVGAAAAVTLLGNIVTLTSPKKNKENKIAAASLIDENKAKVVC